MWEKRSLISTAFGRLNSYKINPNQELIAIGVTNTVGSCFGAYPATGSFSRSALKSKSGVRTPLAGVYTAVVVIVALYGLTPAFFWIPTAALSAIIIHAVADLVASPAQVGLDHHLKLEILLIIVISGLLLLARVAPRVLHLGSGCPRHRLLIYRERNLHIHFRFPRVTLTSGRTPPRGIPG